ncbi:hypothetical protein [Paenibacillus montanisoli]|uniref:DUF5067 domain-containing protein n=1 Tax=Paenibacillus montanisoli TaxID=2081970 RepID=A0A328U8E3_9BACL|nr:hypothetical protein [Paenibacillus montanisoli]RAP77225.1 hypothetical protein DL346_01615 [Paenibacillus montanisoli]
MKRLKNRLRFVSIVSALFILGVIAAIIWYQRADPLIYNGITIYTDPGGKNKVYTIEIGNRSGTEIKLQHVTVNDRKKPDLVQLGITYNSSHLVQFMGNQTDPATKIMDLQDAPIHPQLSAKKIRAVLASNVNSNKSTPIHYGIVVRYDQEPLQEVTIRYDYLGFTKVKHVAIGSMSH